MKISYLLLLLLFLPMQLLAQDQQPKAITTIVARYSEKIGVELRLFPDRRRLLELGFRQGWSIERRAGKAFEFEEIAKIMPYTDAQWNTAIAKASSEESKENIAIAYDFYKGILQDSGSAIDLTNGIAQLREQRSKEDFEFLVFIMQAIKEPEAAKGLGLAFIDASVKSSETYSYRFKLNGSSPVYEIEPKSYDIITKTVENLYQRKIYTKVGDKQLSFIWEEDELLTGVDVERADPGTNNFKQLNEAPIFAIRGKNSKGAARGSFDEDSLVNNTTYKYRFYGYTAFGERVKFAEVEATPRDLTPPQKPFLKQPIHAKPNEVHVSWEMKAPIAKDLKGFAVSRGENNKGRFALLHDKLLPPNARTFIDKSFVKGKTNYYLVQALDTLNNLSSSFPVAVTLIDSVPPSKPEFIEGKMDSLGVVTLHIKPNKEADLMGYRLYRANQADHEFSQIHDIFISGENKDELPRTKTLDTVSIATLTPYVYYRLEALDFNFNTSPVSDILKVKRPDKIPPTTPVFANTKVRPNYVELTFELSRSKDVIAQKLYRKIDVNKPWEILAVLKKNQKLYKDTKVKQDVTYYYTLQAEDDSGNVSKFAIPVKGKPYDNGVRPTVKNLRFQKLEKSILLEWDYETINDNTYFVIYKKNSDGNFIQYGNSSKTSFHDNIINGNTFAVKVFTKDGGQSRLSKAVVFN